MVRIRSAPGQRSLLTEYAICTRCGRILTDPVSVARCLGRACARREAEERDAAMPSRIDRDTEMKLLLDVP